LKSYGTSKIEKIWLKYKNSAPHIFAFYPFLARALQQDTRSPQHVLSFIEKLASNEERLKRVLGRAAYAAGVLKLRVHDFRLEDFKNIEPVEPPLWPFNQDETAIIGNIDRSAAIA
jgi:hypothetical protein